MRLLGAFFVFLSIAFFGVLSAQKLSIRLKKLISCRKYIQFVGEEMRHSRKELPEIFNKTEGDVFVKNGEWCGTGGLNAEDLGVISSFLKGLGTTDIEGQITHTKHHLLRIDELINDAKEEKNRLARMYVSLGFLGGAFVAILLL